MLDPALLQQVKDIFAPLATSLTFAATIDSQHPKAAELR